MPWAMPPAAKLGKNKVPAVLQPVFGMRTEEASPSTMQCILFPKRHICKTFLQPLQLGLVTNANSVYLFNNGLPVNYNARKNRGNNLKLDPTKISL